MDKLIPVENEKLGRDSIGVIHNTDTDGFRSYMNQRKLKINEVNRVKALEDDVHNIKLSLDLILKALGVKND